MDVVEQWAGAEVNSGSGAAAAPTPPASGPITSNDDYLARLVALVGQMDALLVETDCDRLAAQLRSFTETNRATTQALVAWTKTHDIDEAAMVTALGPEVKKAGYRMEVYEKCKSNKAFTAALEAMNMAPPLARIW